MYPRNAASPPRIAVGAVIQISDGAVQSSGVSIAVRGTGAGTESAGGGTTSYGGSSGIVYYVPTQAETNQTDFVVTAYKTGCIPVSQTIVTSAASVAGQVDVWGISGDSTAANNAESFFDGTGYAGANNTIGTVTTLTNLPAITSNWLTAAGIAASALDGKGDWNIGKTGYSLTATTGLGNQTANITGSVSSVTGNVDGNVTGTVAGVTPAAAGAQMDLVNAPNATAITAINSGMATTANVSAVETDTQDIQSRLPDALVGGAIKSDVLSISGSTTAADNLEASSLGIIPGTAATGTLSTTVMTSDLTGYLDDELIGRVIVWTGGTAAGQASDITDYASASGMVTYTAITTAPANGDTFVIV